MEGLGARKGEAIIDKDETPGAIDVAKIPTLKPAFKKDGTVTAASSASISDGAAAVVLTRESFAATRGLKPLARILGYARTNANLASATSISARVRAI